MQIEKSLNLKLPIISTLASCQSAFNLFLVYIFFIFIFLIPATPCLAIDLDEYPEVNNFIDLMVDKHHFSAEELQTIFQKAEIMEKVVTGMDSPREAVPWYLYRKQFVTVFGAKRGARFWKKYEPAVTAAAEQYGVAPEIILAIIGVESQYGHNAGHYRVMDALSTLAFSYPRRGKIFKGELEHFLLLARELNEDPLSIKSSYAGAMGYPQFLPSSYRNYAVDFDNDGRIDLINSAADAIGSVGNYFKVHGWQKDEPIVDRVTFSKPIDSWLLELDIKPKLTVANLGFYSIKPRKYKKPERKVALIKLENEKGKFIRLGFENFYVITRYNKSVNYAMAVFELSQLIKSQYAKTVVLNKK